jgi:multicomponent Na+:H+ antiporter subunit C
VSTFLVYASGSVLLVAIGTYGALTRRHLVRQILCLNIMGGGVFLFLIAVAFRNGDPEPDPVPHALVLTGIVVAVSISAFALALARRIQSLTGRTELLEEGLE